MEGMKTQPEISRRFANSIFEVLVEQAGAHDAETEREAFVYHMTNGCDEYRFGGFLGFGGKLRVNSRGVYVDCYPEDLTAGRRACIERTNAELTRLATEAKGSSDA